MNLNLITEILKMNLTDGAPVQGHMVTLKESQEMVFHSTIALVQNLHFLIFGHSLNARQTTLNLQNLSVGTGRQRKI